METIKAIFLVIVGLISGVVGIAAGLYTYDQTSPKPTLTSPPPAVVEPLERAKGKLDVFIDPATGCHYLHYSHSFIPRTAGNGQSHKGCNTRGHQ